MCAGCLRVRDWHCCSLLDSVFVCAGRRNRLAVLFTVGFCVHVCMLSGHDRLAVLFTVGFCVHVCMLSGHDRLAVLFTVGFCVCVC